MLKKVIIATLVCTSLSACATTGGSPSGTVGTEKFVANALAQYGVVTGTKSSTTTASSPGV